MKRILIIFALLAIIIGKGKTQECLSGNCSLAGSYEYPTGGPYTLTTSWQTRAYMNGGNWTRFSVTSGLTYEWTYCEAYGGVSTAWDAQLTLRNYSTGSVLCYSDDECGTNGNAPYIRWTATFTGTVQLLTSVYNCTTNSGAPYNTLAYRQAGGATECANLTPYQPSSWDNKIVLSTVPGTSTSATTFYDNQIIYIDWAAVNNGSCNITQTFYTKLYLDGVLQNTYSTSGLNSNYYASMTDLTIGPLAAGSHTFQIVVDANGNVSETNESDNSYSRTITVTSSVCANLTPYQPSGWDNKIVLSTVPGTNTSATTFYNNQIIYIDWAAVNNGTCNITQTFYTKLYLDGVLQNTYSTSGLNSNYYASMTDLTIGPLAAGPHTFQIVVDANGNVSETNESDNSYSRTITITPGVCANLTPYQPSGWDNKIVLSTAVGTNTSATTFYDNQTIYIDWAAINNGTCNITQTFDTKLYLDGVLHNTYNTPGLNSNSYAYITDLNIGPLTTGSHTFQIVVDANSDISETNESDNSYSRTITIADGVCIPSSVSTAFNGVRTIYTDLYQFNTFRLNDNCQTANMHIRDWNSIINCVVNNSVEITNSTNSWTTQNERFGASVQWATKQSYNYFLNIHGRNSYDNNNGSVSGYINAWFGIVGSCTSDNASMSFTGGIMKVGLGSSGTLNNSFCPLDIIAHEYTHAVTGSSGSAQLEYQDESGALNESFSDIFGEAIENYTLGSNDWLIGDDRTSGAIRSLSNPNDYSNPDTYHGDFWYFGTGDNGGVHTNSGVQNYWFYLLAQGGSGENDDGYSYNITGIGLTKARSIAYRNLTVYLTSTSDYSDARLGSIQAAEDLYGIGSTEANAVKSAWCAVGVGTCQPTNDECSGSFAATPLTFGSSCSPTSSTSYGATSSGFSSCYGTQDDDVFFSFIPTSTSATITVGSSSGYDAVFQVLTGPCSSSMTQLSCMDDNGMGESETATVIGLTPGVTYFVRVWHYFTGYGTTGNFTICVYGCPTPGSVSVSGGGISCNSALLTASGGSGGTIYWQGTTSNGTSTATPSTSQTVTSSGTYYFRAYNSCGWGAQGSATVTVYPSPSTPANPTSNSPQCGSVTITRTGSPPAGETWYWQGTSCGTSTSLGSGSTYFASSSGTYYIRSYNSTCGTWSTSCASATVTVFPAPATPATPISNSPQCGSVTITRTGSPPSGETWYWQGTSCGTSTALGFGTTFSATSTGTYYIRSYNSACGTWSTSCASTAVTVYPTPAIPTTPISNSPQCGSVTITRTGSPPAGETWYWQGTSCGTSTALGFGNTFSATSTGTYYIRSYNSTCGAWSTSCASMAVTVNNPPSQPGNITGNSTPNQGTYETYSISTVQGADYYTWSLPVGWTGNSTSTSITTLVGSNSGTISVHAINSCGASLPRTLNVNIAGVPAIVISPLTLAFGDVLLGSNSSPQSYYIQGSNLSGAISINAPLGFNVSLSQTGPWTGSLTLPPTGGNLNATVYVRFSPTVVGGYSGNIINASAGAVTQNVAVSGTGIEVPEPVIYINPIFLYQQGNYVGTCAPAQTYTISASNLIENLTIVVEISGSAFISLTGEEDDYSTTIILEPQNGSILPTNVFVRNCPSQLIYEAFIVNSSSGIIEYVHVITAPVAGNAPVTTITGMTAAPGSNVIVPVTVANYDFISWAHFEIDYDPEVMVFQNVEFDIPTMINVTVIEISQSLSRLLIAVGQNDDYYLTLPENTILFNLVFEYAAGYSDLTFTNNCYFQNYWYLTPNDEPNADYYINGYVGPLARTMNLELNLEGLYSMPSGLMKKAQGESGDYFGGTIADQISIRLAEGVFPYSILFQTEAINLDQNGHCQVEVPYGLDENYYIVISHRNSIETWSAYPIYFGGSSVTYNFTSSASKAYGNNLKPMSGRYYIFGGDVNQDGTVDLGDMSPTDNDASGFMSGYISTDVNGDAVIDIGDMTIIDNNAGSFVNAIYPTSYSSSPTVVTSAVSGITTVSTSCGGNVISQGSSAVTARGVCWSPSANPDITDSHTLDGTGPGSFVSNISGLTPGTFYHIRAFATNSSGTVYGEELSFYTILYSIGSGMTDFDGNEYPSIILGTQEWIAGNLIVTHYRNGELIPIVTQSSTWNNLTSGAYCWYNNDEVTYENTYGALYNWYTVTDNRNLCPTGWRAPNDNDWNILANYLGGTDIAGGRMKSIRTVPDPHPRYEMPNVGANNISGFNGLPGGYRLGTGVFEEIGRSGYWWNSTVDNANNTSMRALDYNGDGLYMDGAFRQTGFSVRCLKD